MAKSSFRTLLPALLLVLVAPWAHAQDAAGSVTARWVFRTVVAAYDSPHSEVWLEVSDAKGSRLYRCGQTLGGAHVGDVEAAPVLSVAQGWWAGAGDVYRLRREASGLVVTHQGVDEEGDTAPQTVLSVAVAKSARVVVAPAQERPLPAAARVLSLQKPRLVGDDVDALQFLLTLHGGSVGDIDGIFGPMTETALKRFQKDAGLPPTGATNTETWKALQSWP